ncbi:hypothetical protein CC80DRAFT_484438 [Byssothecium circinans]|uniref:U6 snRNA phosphodiesterase n=1 Tax=Byssothecium circinans TaxID=147558 RepID=A0A6A5TB33_9PLEO|nr:hypothetical protein CC80DRAFT_484438 [Byssothecium circinans]
MALVPYPDSDDDVVGEGRESPLNAQAKPAVKRRRSSELPPLPAAFHDLYSTSARVSISDDPSLHGGRKRAVPHVEGNWPSHVYLEWIPSQAESQNLYALISNVKNLVKTELKTKQKSIATAAPDITPSLLSPLGTPLPLHISLSRTLQIKTDDREVFLDTLTASLRNAAVRPFNIRFSKLKWVSNFECNRWFLVLNAEKPAQDELNRLLRACNDAARRCGHAGLYTGGKGDGPMEGNISKAKKRRKSQSEQPVQPLEDFTENFHVSIAWNLFEPGPAWTALVQDVDVSKHVGEIDIPFSVVKAKIGNVVNSIDLASKKLGSGVKGGLLGLG